LQRIQPQVGELRRLLVAVHPDHPTMIVEVIVEKGDTAR
jgi:hypothetical protein